MMRPVKDMGKDKLIKGGEGGFYMRNIGLRVLRFSDRKVFENIEGVIEKIWENI